MRNTFSKGHNPISCEFKRQSHVYPHLTRAHWQATALVDAYTHVFLIRRQVHVCPISQASRSASPFHLSCCFPTAAATAHKKRGQYLCTVIYTQHDGNALNRQVHKSHNIETLLINFIPHLRTSSQGYSQLAPISKIYVPDQHFVDNNHGDKLPGNEENHFV